MVGLPTAPAGQHDQVGLHPLAGRQDDRAGAAARQLDAVDRDPGAELEVRAARARVSRYVIAVLCRTPSTWLTGSDPAPTAPGELRSSTIAWPACAHASRNARMTGRRLSPVKRRIGTGPPVPCSRRRRVVLHAPEVRQDRLPRPVVIAQADPAVEVAR